MAEVIYRPARVAGGVQIPPSKSAAHRALLCAALCGAPCTVSPVDASADMHATLAGIRALGAGVSFENGVVRVAPGERPAHAVVDCGESGSTLRFLIPVFAALGIEAAFIGRGRLPERPIGVYTALLPQHGVQVETAGGLPLKIRGRLQSGEYRLPGNVSSQFITGLLFALPRLHGDSEIVLTAPLESKGYIDLTVEVLRGFGISVRETPRGWLVPGGQAYRSGERTVEADWSNAAFWLCAGAAGGDVRLAGLRDGSAQGDRAVFDLIGQFGAQISRDANVIRCAHAPLHGIRIDAGPIPDLVPILAVTAAFAQSDTEIYNACLLYTSPSPRD